MDLESDSLGYLEYRGRLVDHGYMDARKSAEALLGFDEALRYFVNQYEPTLVDTPYEIPVRITQGSWLACIPDNIAEYIGDALVLGAGVYTAAAIKKMAENDFKDMGLKHVFSRSLEALQWMIRLGKHLGGLHRKKFSKVSWRNGNAEIGIPDDAGQILFVPSTIFDMYVRCPPALLSGVSRVIVEERILLIGRIVDHKRVEEVITEKERPYFYVGKDTAEDVLFPELVHGEHVSLEGIVTRGNENTNSLGLEYRGHVLNCIPKTGSVVRFKNALFVRASVAGTISRADKFGKVGEHKPKILIDSLVPVDEEETSSRLDF